MVPGTVCSGDNFFIDNKKQATEILNTSALYINKPVPRDIGSSIIVYIKKKSILR